MEFAVFFENDVFIMDFLGDNGEGFKVEVVFFRKWFLLFFIVGIWRDKFCSCCCIYWGLI